MKTFWLVETSVSKYLLCTIQKEKKKKTNVKLNWINDDTGLLSLPKESFCCMSAHRIDCMKYASHWSQRKPDGSMNGIAPINHDYPRKIT